MRRTETIRISHPLKSVRSVVTRMPRWLKTACESVMRETPTAFHAIGWGWGGDWSWPIDYQHFSTNGK